MNPYEINVSNWINVSLETLNIKFVLRMTEALVINKLLSLPDVNM